jgi:formylglycine-generating enzyme required for sulfatase activity
MMILSKALWRFLLLFLPCSVLSLLQAQEFQIKNLDSNGDLTFTEVSGARSYRVEWSSSLAPESWSTAAPGIAEIPALRPGDRTVTVGRPAGRVFFRVVAEMRPPPPQGFVLIPGGLFQMGDSWSEGNLDERPVHTVEVAPFYLQAKETTKTEWDTVYTWALANGYVFDNAGAAKASNHPVVEVNWHDAVKWCNARSQKEGLIPCYYTDAARTVVYKTGQADLTHAHVLWTADGYRLPTEAEWERAARGGAQGRRFPWGDTITHALANYESSSSFAYDTSSSRGLHPSYDYRNPPYTAPVGSFAPNEFGLYDVTGNVWEWCWDRYGANYYASSPSLNPLGAPTGSLRIDRGGSWFRNSTNARTSVRGRFQPSGMGGDLGLRPARRS